MDHIPKSVPYILSALLTVGAPPIRHRPQMHIRNVIKFHTALLCLLPQAVRSLIVQFPAYPNSRTRAHALYCLLPQTVRSLIVQEK